MVPACTSAGCRTDITNRYGNSLSLHRVTMPWCWCAVSTTMAALWSCPTHPAEAAPPLRVWAGKTGRRALLRLTSKDAACGGADDLASSSALLSTSAGFFRPKQIGHTNNLLLMASLSNDVYPWAAQYGITMFDVAGGLTKQQVCMRLAAYHYHCFYRAASATAAVCPAFCCAALPTDLPDVVTRWCRRTTFSGFSVRNTQALGHGA